MHDDKIYYQDQSTWQPSDFYGLWRYLDRLFQFVGPTQKLRDALVDPDALSAHDRIRVDRAARYQAQRSGRRDEEFAALDLTRMSEDTRYLMKHMLIATGRYDLALERFLNLRGLDSVGELGHPLYLDSEPSGVDEYYTQKGIYL